MNRLLLVGNDKIGRRLVSRLPAAGSATVVFDRSSSLARVVRLLRRGTLPLRVVGRMAWADLRRPDTRVAALPAIASNRELRAMIDRLGIDEVILFRAGLIVAPTVLEARATILNVHCATIPTYGGLGSIARALADGAYRQEATLHRVTRRIDEGEVLDREPYALQPRASYRHNEDIAYEAGMQLLLRRLTPACRRIG